MAESTALSPPRCPRGQWHLGSSWSQRAWDLALTVPALQEEGHLAAFCPVACGCPGCQVLAAEAPLPKQPPVTRASHTAWNAGGSGPWNAGGSGSAPPERCSALLTEQDLLSLKAIFS